MESSSTILEIDSVTRQAKVLVPVSYLSKELETALNKYSRNAKIKGFRPGKAPKEMVQKLYGDSLRWDVISKVINSSLEEAIKKNELQLVGTPKIDITCSDPEKDLEYVADFSIYPTPKIDQYVGIQVSVEKQAATDKEIDDVIHNFRKSKATIKAAKDRDVVIADDVIDVTVRFKAKDGTFTPPEQVNIGLGDGRLPKEFDEQIIGLKINEAKEVTIPGSADAEDMTYEVTLNAISERELPEVTDEFVQSLGGESKTVQSLKEEIKERLEKQYEEQANAKAEDAILDKLVEINDFMVPVPLIEDEIRNILIRLGAVDARKTKFEEIPVDPFRETFESLAKKHVKTAIALDQIASLEKIAPNEDDMKTAFKEIAQDMRVSEAEARKMYSGRNLINLAIQISRRKTRGFLWEKGVVEFVAKAG